MSAQARRRTSMQVLLNLLLLVCLFGWSATAMAAAPSCSSTSGTVSLPVIPNVSVSSTTPIGLIGSPVTATVTFSCTPNSSKLYPYYIQARSLGTLDSSNNASSTTGIQFATNIPGIALNLTEVSATAASGTVGFDVGTIGTAGDGSAASEGTLVATFKAQLYKTGTVTAGTYTGTTLIGAFKWVILGYNNSTSVTSSPTLVTTSGTVVTVPSCSVTAPASFTVTLPAVSTSALQAVGSTAGRTPFNLSLTCASGANVTVSMQSSNPSTTVTGVSNPTGTGYATNVGTQLLDSNLAAVNVQGTAQAAVTVSSAGTLLLPYYVQYYETAAPAGVGPVASTVTYTLTYH